MTTEAGLPNGSTTDITFEASSNVVYRVFSVNTSASIGNITITGSATGYTLLIGRTSVVPPSADPDAVLTTPGGGSIGNITAQGGTVQVYSSDSVGVVTAGAIARIDAKNSVAGASSSSTIGVIRAPRILGNITAQGNISQVQVVNWNTGASTQNFASTISSTSGNISAVSVTNARLTGSVLASSGALGTISADLGIGSSTSALSTIRARNGIKSITASEILADIDSSYGGGTGAIEQMNATSGSIYGSISCYQIDRVSGSGSSFIAATGNLDADIRVSERITNHGGVSGGVGLATIRVGGEFSAGRTIVVGNMTFGHGCPDDGLGGFSTGSGGLKGQIIIGAIRTTEFTCASGGSPAFGFWGGSARIGSTVLDPGGCSSAGFTCYTGYQPYYTYLSSALGGGAVGVVPFALHRQDCEPAHNSSVAAPSTRTWSGGSVRQTLVLRHYGPINVRNTSIAPVSVWRQSITVPGATFVDVSSDFDFAVRPSISGVPQERELWVARKLCSGGVPMEFQKGYWYKLELVNTTGAITNLYCADTFAASGSEPNILGSSYPYLCIVNDPSSSCMCAADFDGSGGTPDSTDIEAFFDAWLAGSSTADVDCSGGTPDSTDISIFFCQWLAGGC